VAGDGVAGDGVAGNGAMGHHDACGSVLGLLLRKSLQAPHDCQQHAYNCKDFIRASPPRTCPCGATCDDRSRLEGFVIRTSHLQKVSRVCTKTLLSAVPVAEPTLGR